MANDRVVKALGEKFIFSLANASGASKIVALLPAFFDTLKLTEGTPNVHSLTNAANIVAAGYACDAVADDGTIATGLTLTAQNPKLSYRQFREYIKHQPRVLIDMAMQATNVSAFNGVMEVVKCTPLQGAAVQYLSLSDFRSVDQQATDKINVNALDVDLDFDTLMLIPIPDGVTVTLTFRFS